MGDDTATARKKTYGVVLAGGVGARIGLDVPKQMVKVAGKTILEHTVAAFDACASIDEVIVMVTPGWVESVGQLLAGRYPKVGRILEGGASRNDTTRLVIAALDDVEAKVILHDAVRPLVDDQIIVAAAAALDDFEAVDTVIASADTIVAVDEAQRIIDIPDRSRLRRGQTPQAFSLPVLRRAYALAAADPGFHATDDCGVVLTYCPDVAITCIPGSDHNIKITHPVDLYIADKLFQLASRTAPERDLAEIGRALAGQVIVVIGGSSGIGQALAELARRVGIEVVVHGRAATGLHVEQADSVVRSLDDTARQYGRIDAVILTAGLLTAGPIVAVSPEQTAEAIGVNVIGPINVARAAHRHLAATGGHLLMFASSSYTRGRAGLAIYSAAKAAVVNLTQALAEEWADDGIKVNVMNPERTSTPMRRQAFGEEPPGTLLSAEQVALAALSVLASDQTGMVIDVRRDEPEG